MNGNDSKYLQRAIAKGNIPTQPGVYHLATMHDNWCLRLNGKGLCNCDPEMTFTDDRGIKKQILKNGDLKVLSLN